MTMLKWRRTTTDKSLGTQAEMRVILVSLLLYLLGVAAVLYFKPAVMFHSDGRWKEFGLHGDERTAFPFWAFCITYALVSFLVARLAVEGLGSASSITSASTVAAVTTAVTPIEPIRPAQKKKKRVAPIQEEESSSSEEEEVTLRKGNTVPYSNSMKPGYYRLNTKSRKGGVPQYIYLGAESPESSDAEEDTRAA